MSGIVEIRMWGTTIGHLGYSPGQTRIATFEYDDAFVNSGIGISPARMACPPVLHSFPDISFRTFKGLPGIFADSLPDKYGNQLIDLYLAEKNIPPENITALDRLLYVGTRGMGALEYHPAEEIDEGSHPGIELNLNTLAELAGMVTSKQEGIHRKLLQAETRNQALRLIRVGSSAGGARSKALVAISPDGRLLDGSLDHGNDHTYWILKFDSGTNIDRDGIDPAGMPRVEYVYSTIARKCGIELPKTDYIAEGDDFHFLIERFDRFSDKNQTGKLHYASWAGLAHADRDTTGAYSYEQLILLARQMGLGQDSVTELFRRAVFNIIGRNQDDHTKNFGFLMNKSGEWRLSPAFDMTYAFDPQGKWTRVHQISMNRKQDDFERDDLVEFGRYCNLSSKKADRIISDTIDAFSEFKPLAENVDVPPDLMHSIANNMRLRL